MPYFMDITYAELPAILSSFVLCIECIFDKNCNKTKILDNKVKSWSPATYFKYGKCQAEVH